MNNIKKLTNAYLYQLAQMDIDSINYTKIVTSLQDVDAYTSDTGCPDKENRMKALLVDRLSFISGVDKISINDSRGFQIDGLDIRVNGMGPVTILIIGKEEGVR